MAASTWLTPASETWEAKFGAGTFPFPMAGKHLKPLLAAGHSPELIASHLGRYLSETPPQFLNLAKFAMTFQSWAPKASESPVQDWTSLVDESGVLRSG